MEIQHFREQETIFYSQVAYKNRQSNSLHALFSHNAKHQQRTRNLAVPPSGQSTLVSGR